LLGLIERVKDDVTVILLLGVSFITSANHFLSGKIANLGEIKKIASIFLNVSRFRH
jgi:hypothetical protein